MRSRWVLAVSVISLLALPAVAVAKPHTIARTSRLDFGPELSGSRVVIAAAPKVMLVDAHGKATTLRGVNSPVTTQRTQVRAATPEGSLSVSGGPLAVSASGLAWLTSETQIDPSMDLLQSAGGYFRSPLPRGTDQYLGGYAGFGGSSGTLAKCDPVNGHGPERFSEIALSEAVLAYVVQRPPPECPQPDGGGTQQLVVRPVASGQLGPERVLAQAPGGPIAFTLLRATGQYVAWVSDRTLTVVDSRTGNVFYTVPDVAPKALALDAGGTIAIETSGGEAEWASPDDEALHPLGFGTPFALADGIVLLRMGRSLVLRPVDDEDRQLVKLHGSDRFAGTPDYNGEYATWAVRHKVCKRVHRRRRCKHVDSVRLRRLPSLG
jgi:hypothetical protein